MLCAPILRLICEEYKGRVLDALQIEPGGTLKSA